MCAAGLACGGLARLLVGPRLAEIVWGVTSALLLGPLVGSVLRTLMRGDVGVDAIALVSIVGALALHEYLAGAVIALMLAGGNALEERAGWRARRELTALVSRAPRTATLIDGAGAREVAVDDVAVGDVILVHA